MDFVGHSIYYMCSQKWSINEFQSLMVMVLSTDGDVHSELITFFFSGCFQDVACCLRRISLK